MKILVIVPEQLPVPPILGGSVETVAHHVFRRVARTDTVRLISRTHPRLPNRSVSVGGRYCILRVPHANRKRAYLREALRRAAKVGPFDIIQIENRPAFVPEVRKAFPRTPIVLSLHSLTFMSKLSLKQAYFVLGLTNRVVTVSTVLANTMKRRYPRYAHKFYPAVIGVDPDTFRPRSKGYKKLVRKKWSVAGSFNVLFVGRIVPKKGLHTLVRAVAIVKKRHPNTRLVAVGSSWPGKHRATPYMRGVRALSSRLKVPIRFTGYIPPAKVHQAYHLGDVFVCPTQYKEGFALVNAEAMASGVPVIASDRGGIREVIKHGRTGLLVSNYKSPQAFAAAIRRVKESPGLARALASAGRRSAVAGFSWNNTARTLRRYYVEMRGRGG